MPNLKLHDHALITHKVTLLRDRKCSASKFRHLTREIAAFLTYQATADLPLKDLSVQPPDATRAIDRPVIRERKAVVVPILRAGLVMAEGALSVMPAAHVGHLGFSRNADYTVTMYLAVLPDPENRTFFLYDAVIGTGNTACAAIDLLKVVAEVDGGHIRFLTILITPEGEEKLAKQHPDVTVHAVSREEGLDSEHHIIPGFGDASDRLFGIK